ncbi:MAG: LacI family DNA-binding transcriptional regulator [Mycetocola sp.]
MPKAPTIRDVASHAGVSIAVVSRVLNPGSGPVAEATRDRVLTSVAELGYRPRTAARELKNSESTVTIGLLLADVTNPFFARLADKVVWEARARGVQVLLMTTQEDQRLEEECLDTLYDRRVAGVIATPTSTNVASWQRLHDFNTRVVFVDRSISDFDHADTVSINNVSSARSATERLLELGHRRIGLISGPRSTSTGLDRTAGYHAAHEAAGVPVDPALVRHIPFRGDQGGDSVASLLDSADPPTALIIANTAQVTSALHRLHSMPVVVPDDLSVVVFDDNPWTELVTPALSIIRQPIDMLAAHSVDLALSHRAPGPTQHLVVDADYVERSSTLAPRV